MKKAPNAGRLTGLLSSDDEDDDDDTRAAAKREKAHSGPETNRVRGAGDEQTKKK